jgi:hypothetical protein
MIFARLVLKRRFEIKFETRFDPGLTSADRGRLRGGLLLADTDSVWDVTWAIGFKLIG